MKIIELLMYIFAVLIISPIFFCAMVIKGAYIAFKETIAIIDLAIQKQKEIW